MDIGNADELWPKRPDEVKNYSCASSPLMPMHIGKKSRGENAHCKSFLFEGIIISMLSSKWRL